MHKKKAILLKLTGESLSNKKTGLLDPHTIVAIANQITELQSRYTISIVIGGGNFLRGKTAAPNMGIRTTTSHHVGMLGTVANGLIIADIFQQQSIKTTLLSALTCPEISQSISQQEIDWAHDEQRVIIFTGGTGNPYFTTDTTAIIRALQTGAQIVWKGTKVDGVYDKDPYTNHDARKFARLSYTQAISNQLNIMDMTAFVLAQQYDMTIRVFNIFEPNALIKVDNEPTFGTIITNKEQPL